LAAVCVAADPRNAEVLFPYLNGEDLNSRPDASASRWVIDFNDRSEEEAASYRLPWGRVTALVKPERQRTRSDGSLVLRRPLPQRYWQYGEKRPALRRAIADLPEVLVIARVSKTVMPLRIPTGSVMSEACVVFATADYGDQALLSSSLHQLWAITYGSTLETRVRYTPSDVFETIPRPGGSDRLAAIGRTLDEERREIMSYRNLGLTGLYNLVDDPGTHSDADVAKLRSTRQELDKTVVDAYGWADVQLNHGFYNYRGTQRWSIAPSAWVELRDRLLSENRRRARPK
jgi:hypothetical protein